jgi:hypothetical protein
MKIVSGTPVSRPSGSTALRIDARRRSSRRYARDVALGDRGACGGVDGPVQADGRGETSLVKMHYRSRRRRRRGPPALPVTQLSADKNCVAGLSHQCAGMPHQAPTSVPSHTPVAPCWWTLTVPPYSAAPAPVAPSFLKSAVELRSAAQDGLNRLEGDEEVETDRHVLGSRSLQFLHRALTVAPRSTPAPAGQPRLRDVTLTRTGSLSHSGRDSPGAADQAHFASRPSWLRSS